MLRSYDKALKIINKFLSAFLLIYFSLEKYHRVEDGAADIQSVKLLISFKGFKVFVQIIIFGEAFTFITLTG